MVMRPQQYARWFGAEPISAGTSGDSTGNRIVPTLAPKRPGVMYGYWPMVLASVTTYIFTRILDRTLFKETP